MTARSIVVYMSSSDAACVGRGRAECVRGTRRDFADMSTVAYMFSSEEVCKECNGMELVEDGLRIGVCD